MKSSQPIQPPGSKVWTIPPGAPFLRTLARRVLAGGFPTADLPPPTGNVLADYTILVPTRRAARELADAFLDVSDGQALLLPRIRPLGDVDEDELLLTSENAGADNLSLPPAISPLRRQLLLAKFLLEWARTHDDTELARALLPGPSQAILMAGGLGQLLDQLETEQVEVAALGQIVKEDFAHYWQDILLVLDLIRTQLPDALEQRGMIGPAQRRNLLIEADVSRLAASSPSAPVIAAGSTGSIPATAHLLKAISQLPNGGVVLPGLDTHLDEESWEELDPQHPQFGLKQLLGELGVTRNEVIDFNEGEQETARLFSEVMRPSATTHLWRNQLASIGKSAASAMQKIALVPTANRREEALAIALLMRETLETPGKTAALITPDRNLGRQVCAELRRWDLQVDDSAGIPLARTIPGSFVHLLLDAAMGFDPAALIALAQHPLARFGQNRQAFSRAMHKLELCALRGTLTIRDLADLPKAVDAKQAEVEKKPNWHPHLRRWKERDWQEARDVAQMLVQTFNPFTAMQEADAPLPLDTTVKTVVSIAEAVAAGEGGDASALWSHEAGENLAAFFAGLMEAGSDSPLISVRDIAPVIMELMLAPVVRPRFGSHPRLRILGLLEARLVSADVVVLGGLNEDVWPQLPRSDPWLNRPMRGELGLQQPERRIGLAAHDFAQAVCGSEVWLTWSARLDGAPAVPSRWILRLRALLTASKALAPATKGERTLAACRLLDEAPSVQPAARPEPRPAVELRPRRLTITEIETWLRDPYSIFARHILKLAPLEPVNVMPGPRERGNIVHGILEEFLEKHASDLPQDISQVLQAIGNEHFSNYLDWPEVRAFWQPRFAGIAEALEKHEPELRNGVAQTFVECRGECTLSGPAGAFRLSGRADRIDIFDSGEARIIDYKTGAIPTGKQVLSGLAPQLLLEAAILRRDGFKEVGTFTATELTYVHLPGGNPAVNIRPVKPSRGQTIEEVAEAIFARLEERITEFDDADTPYLSRRIPRDLAQVFAYDHLARHREWASSETGGDGA